MEEHFLGETIATLGQRDATERVAWALARIRQRLTALGQGTKTSVQLPFRQHELADALGISTVHTSRTVSILRNMGLVEWKRGHLTLLDPDRLFALAGLPMEREEQRPLI